MHLRKIKDRASKAVGESVNELAGLSKEEASIRVHSAEKVANAMDVSHPTTRNTAVKLAAKSKGPFNVDQVARVWLHAYKRWSYVNDPKGQEYFAKASESIENDYAGDCDDFAIVLAAMIQAIGGESRVVMMSSDQGGHAYTEIRVAGELKKIRTTLDRFVRRNVRGKRLREIHARPAPPTPDGQGSYWLNLDWNAQLPGGPYEKEHWAVAIYPDGSTESLAPAGDAE